MDMGITGMGTLVMSVYKSYGAVLFEGVVQLKLFPETKIKPFEYIVPQRGTIQGCGTNPVNTVAIVVRLELVTKI